MLQEILQYFPLQLLSFPVKKIVLLCLGVLREGRTVCSWNCSVTGSLSLPVCGFSHWLSVLRLYGVPGGSQAQFTFVIPSVGTHTLAFPALLHQVPISICYLFLFSNDLLTFLVCCRLLFFLNLAFVRYLLKSFTVNFSREINLN